ncbi:hypothetical protein ACVBEQ_04780 [Nakamurella sp. GG22]
MLGLCVGFAAIPHDNVFASTLGGLRTASLLGQNFMVGAVLATFDQPSGTNLATTSDTCGNAWHVLGGTITIGSGTAVSASTGLVTASVPLCNGGTNPNEEVGGDIHSSGSSTFGLVLNAQPGGRASTAAVYSNASAGSLRIQRVAADGTVTVWATISGTGGGNTPRFLRFSYINGTYQASINNVVLLTYAVTAAEKIIVEANNELGLISVSDTRSTFDNLQSYSR